MPPLCCCGGVTTQPLPYGHFSTVDDHELVKFLKDSILLDPASLRVGIASLFYGRLQAQFLSLCDVAPIEA